MNKSESKYFNTALLMDQALVSLLAEKDIEYISIKEICEKAGVNRSTFYLHYETIGDLLEETVDYILSHFLSSFDKTPELFCEQIENVPLSKLVFLNEKYLIPYLQFICDNRVVFKASINNPASMKTDKMYSEIKKYVLEPIMHRFQIQKDEQNYWLAYYMSGIWAIIQEWISRDCKESVEQIERIIERCVRPVNTLQNKKFGE